MNVIDLGNNYGGNLMSKRREERLDAQDRVVVGYLEELYVRITLPGNYKIPRGAMLDLRLTELWKD